MTSKTVVKVFKRKDIESSSIHHTSEPVAAPQTDREEKTERRLQRDVVSTVSNWISERRERSRREEVEGLKMVFGDATPRLSEA